MKRMIILIIAVVIFSAIGYYYYEMSRFANGVNNDAKRRNEVIKKRGKSLDTANITLPDRVYMTAQ